MAKQKKYDNKISLSQKTNRTFELDQLFTNGTEVNKNNHFIQELSKRLVDK